MIRQLAQKIDFLNKLFHFCRNEQPSSDVCEQHDFPKLKEAFVQALWNEKSAQRTFTCLDGSTVKVLFPGSWNDESGPDFTNAELIFITASGVETRKQGDVEIHLRPADWFAHKHEQNENFSNVILHAVWEESLIYPEHLPTVCLRNQLDTETIKQINSFDWIHYPDGLKYPPCPLAPYLVMKSNSELQHFFAAAGVIRFREKTARMRKQIISCGREQTLYQGIADALGFKNNRKQFSTLCNTIQYHELKKLKSKKHHHAVLFGASGLLPDFTSDPILAELETHVKELWEIWWSKRSDNLPEMDWKHQGRPLNSPERRIAALAELTAPPKRIIKQILNSLMQNQDQKIKHWQELLTVENEIWESLTRFNKKLKTSSSLIGSTRRNEIIANIILPFAAAATPEDENQYCDLFLTMPPLQHNHLIKEAVNRFLIPPARSREIIKNNGIQQGMMKLIKESSNITEISPHHPLVKLLINSE